MSNPAQTKAATAPRRMPEDAHAVEVLDRRARKLAALTEDDGGRQAGKHFLKIRLGGHGWFALPRECAREVVSAKGMASVPGTPGHIAGVISLRGDIIAVLDLPAWFGLGRTARARTDTVVVVECAGTTAGILTEASGEEFVCDPGALAPPPEGAAISAKWIDGIHDADVAILNIDAIMADPGMTVND
jgi:purine-binding chemotaxis protein CheW